MAREHGQQLQKTLWDLQRRYGDGVIETLAQHKRPTSISTGFPSLDAMLSSQGIPRGRLTMFGAGNTSTSGITTLAYRSVAQAQQAAPVVYIDLTNTLDADYAADCGVTLDRLLVVRGVDVTQALSLTRDIVSASTPSLIVIDLIVVDADLTLAQFTILLRRMTEALTKSRCAVLFLTSTPHRFAQGIHESADIVVSLNRRDWKRRGHDVVGYSVDAVVTKDREHSSERRVVLDIPLYRAADGNHP